MSRFCSTARRFASSSVSLRLRSISSDLLDEFNVFDDSDIPMDNLTVYLKVKLNVQRDIHIQLKGGAVGPKILPFGLRQYEDPP